jgi:hypothetical protein
VIFGYHVRAVADESIFCLTRAEQSQLQKILTLQISMRMRRGNLDPRIETAHREVITTAKGVEKRGAEWE